VLRALVSCCGHLLLLWLFCRARFPRKLRHRNIQHFQFKLPFSGAGGINRRFGCAWMPQRITVTLLGLSTMTRCLMIGVSRDQRRCAGRSQIGFGAERASFCFCDFLGSPALIGMSLARFRWVGNGNCEFRGNLPRNRASALVGRVFVNRFSEDRRTRIHTKIFSN